MSTEELTLSIAQAVRSTRGAEQGLHTWYDWTLTVVWELDRDYGSQGRTVQVRALIFLFIPRSVNIEVSSERLPSTQAAGHFSVWLLITTAQPPGAVRIAG